MTQRLRHLPTCLVVSGILLLLAAPLAWLLSGAVAAAGAAAGVCLVVVSYLISSLVVAWVDLVARQLLLPIVLLTYALKFAVFGVVLFEANRAQWGGLFALGVAVIVATVGWTGAHLYWQLHAKILYVEV